jgi:hypothetical protein
MEIKYPHNGIGHYHCPEGCEKPQPFIAEWLDNKVICGRCWCLDDVATECIPCIDEDNCEGE